MGSMKLFTLFCAVICIYAGQIWAQTTDGYDIVCPEEDAFVPHHNCSLYYQCGNWIPYLQECPPGTYFSPETKNCEHPDDVSECREGTRPTEGTTTSTTPSTTTTTISTTTTTTTTTPPTTTTTTPTTTTTTPTTTTTTATTTTTETPPTEGPFECPPTGVHDFPFPGNCSLYYRCISGTPFVQECAEGLLFDIIDRTCKPVADAVCEGGEVPPTTTSEPPEFDCPPSGFDTFPHASNCSMYYLCSEGSLLVESCAFGNYYDASPAIKECNLANDAACNSECPAEGIHYFAIRTSVCDYYKVCFNGNSVNLHCAEGSVYHPEEQRCVTIDAYTCPYAG